MRDAAHWDHAASVLDYNATGYYPTVAAYEFDRRAEEAAGRLSAYLSECWLLRKAVSNGNRWSYEVQRILKWHEQVTTTVEHQPIYDSEDECVHAQFLKAAKLDETYLREPHFLPGQTKTVTTTIGNLSKTEEQNVGPIETLVVTHCERSVR